MNLNLYFILAIEWAENYNLDDIVTPVKAENFRRLLEETNYDKKKTKYLIEGFTNGFDIHYQGRRDIQRKSPNLRLYVGDLTDLWNKVIKEVKASRFAGPYEEIPYEHYIQSPIGLVPKDKGKKTRLIFHLSHPRSRERESVNSCIPKELCTVKYPDFEDAIKLCVEEGVSCKMSKSDMSMAFRHVPLKKTVWKFLIMKAFHPVTHKLYYFVEKCMSFGCSISPKIFQDVSDGIAHIVKVRTGKKNVNYLDDYFFASILRQYCDWQVEMFLNICKEIAFPVSLEKTFWSSTLMTFLGLLLDSENQVVCIPLEKIEKALNLVEYFLNKHNKKVTVLQVQKLTGFLNFLCKCVIPGRAFTRRMYSYTSSKLMPHHHIRMTEEMRLDMNVWKQFLLYPGIFCRPFLEFTELTARDINMYSDSSRHFRKGFGAVCDDSWMFGVWDEEFMKREQPSIEYLELFAVTAAVVTWIHRFRNKRIYLFCDNKSAVDMINGSSSRCKNCMVLIRIITLESLVRNVRVFAKHVRSKKNSRADALLRLEFKRFWRVSPKTTEAFPTEIPTEIWPLNRIWMK